MMAVVRTENKNGTQSVGLKTTLPSEILSMQVQLIHYPICGEVTVKSPLSASIILLMICFLASKSRNTSLFTISAYKTYDDYRAQQSKRKVSTSQPAHFHSALVGFQQRDGRCRDLN
jgi:hypothetical protein